MDKKEQHKHWEKDWLEGKISSDEAASNASDPASFDMLRKYVEKTALLTPPENKSKAAAWAHIQANIAEAPEAKVISINRRYWLTGIAASFLLIASAFFLLKGEFEGDISVSTDLAEVQTIYLPDSSVVYLNAESSVYYSQKNWQTNRTLTLDGEAFFEVKSGSNFVVNTANGKVEVLGTSFNVRSRAADFEVACKTGRVRVTAFLSNTKRILTPGLKTRVNSGVLIDPIKTNLSDVDLWRTGEYYLESTSIKEGFEELERIYNITIIHELSETELGRPGTWDFDKNKLLESIQQISGTMGYNFEIKGDSIYIKQR